MWIKNDDELFNTDHFVTIEVHRCRIFGITENRWLYTLGEFWTTKEAHDIFRSIHLALTNGEKFIMIKNTRDGCKCLKKKSVPCMPVDAKPVLDIPKKTPKQKAKELLDNNIPKPEIAFFG